MVYPAALRASPLRPHISQATAGHQASHSGPRWRLAALPSGFAHQTWGLQRRAVQGWRHSVLSDPNMCKAKTT